MQHRIAGFLLALFVFVPALAFAIPPSQCTTIPTGNLETTMGDPIEPGVDEWGYNYQARRFGGGYCEAYRNASWCADYADVHLDMEWNWSWLDNKDCDDDTLLDRHYGTMNYLGSGAWLTNHMRGIDEDTGEHWTYFVMIEAAPLDAYMDSGVWYNSDGEELGPEIWGEFYIAHENTTGPSSPGLDYHSAVGPGFGRP